MLTAEKVLSVNWKYITPQAPQQGGLYERLVELMRISLKKAMGKAVPTDFEFENLVVRVESILNTRPLLQLSDDSNEVLRPVRFSSAKYYNGF